jgi:uncharacterized membrane protein
MARTSSVDVPGDAVRFEAVIVPHRSLSPAGMRWVMAGLLGLSALISTGLWFLGAWPVIGFPGFGALLALWLVRRNAAQARAREFLVLSARELVVLRYDGAKWRDASRFEPYWLRARLEERPGRTPALVLRDRARLMEIATALGEEEKRDLAASLQAALERLRNPVFDNPQLREGETNCPPGAPST